MLWFFHINSFIQWVVKPPFWIVILSFWVVTVSREPKRKYWSMSN